jgi:hypothetical protein
MTALRSNHAVFSQQEKDPQASPAGHRKPYDPFTGDPDTPMADRCGVRSVLGDPEIQFRSNDRRYEHDQDDALDCQGMSVHRPTLAPIPCPF